MGNLAFALVGWGKLNRKCQVSNDFLSVSENSFKRVLDEMEEFKGRDDVRNWLTKKKRSSKVIFKGRTSEELWLRNSSLSYYRVNTIW